MKLKDDKIKFCRFYGWMTSLTGLIILVFLVWFFYHIKVLHSPQIIERTTAGALGGFSAGMIISSVFFFRNNFLRGIRAARGGFGFIAMGIIFNLWHLMFSNKEHEPLWVTLLLFLLVGYSIFLPWKMKKTFASGQIEKNV
ncbi:MAG: hypothetical protein J0H55_08495 [Chitinophagaceae bacterium]|nr:hypothetical protein [Chitinophagaceae bacterium]